MNLFRTIRTFAHVPVQPRTLFAIDLDDTTWKYSFPFDGNLLEWKEQVKQSAPELVDPIHFREFLERVRTESSCHLLFLTARDADLYGVTCTQLKRFVDIPYSLALTGGQPKGPVLRHLLDTKFSNCEHVVFVDDLIENIENVHKEVPHAHVFHFLSDNVRTGPSNPGRSHTR